METLGQFTLMEPDEFGQWLIQQLVTRRIVTVQQHHTWIPNHSSFSGDNHFTLQQSMKRSHLQRGFSDIAQHFSIFPDGKICTGRSLNNIPAGIKGANTGAVCIENIGNFDSGGDVMTPLQTNGITLATAVILQRFGIQTNTDGIIYHHWFDLTTGHRTNGTGNTKTCPGTNFFGGNSVQNCIDNFIPQVEAQLNSIAIDNPAEGVAVLHSGEVNVDTLNVRSGPSSQYKIVDAVHMAAEVECYQTSGLWWRIHPTESMWVYSKYITID